MTELILIRHGETDWNRELRFQGQVDVPLNSIGQEQARRLGLQLAAERFHHVIASDLQRAMQTADTVARLNEQAELPAPLRRAALREQAFGLVDGMRVPDIKERHPQEWSRWIQFDADYRFAGGESVRQFHARVMGAMAELEQQFTGQTLVVVTHGGVLDMVYRSALHLPLSGPRQCNIPNAGLNRVLLRGEQIDIIEWAQTAHLADLPAQPVYDQRKLAQDATRAATTPLAG